MRFEGRTVSIFGLGRSGLAIAKAVIELGGRAVVYDQSAPDSLAKPEVLHEARALGAEVVLNWAGDLPALLLENSGLLVVNPAVDKRSPILAKAQAQGYELVSEVEFAYRISKAPIVAITGTNGKSTTTVMTYLCLKTCGVDAVLCGNIFGSGYMEVPLTEAALDSKPDQVLVAEISSFQLEWVKEFRPIAAGITNISEDHLERYDSFEDYAKTKLRIFRAQGMGDFGVIESGDLRTWVSEINASPSYMTFGEDAAQTWIADGKLTVLGTEVPLAELPFGETHNLRNAQLAALLAQAALVSTGRAQSEAPMQPCVLNGLKQFKGLAHRMERLGERNGVQLINNSMCTNVEAVKASVGSIPGPSRILLGGKDKDLDFRPLKELFNDGVHHAYVYGEAKTKITEQIGAKLVYETMEAALRAALDDARRGETVMLAPACASTDQFRDFRHRGDVFRQLAKEWLES
jgi:UDP-N-acetylmuramoylalanine--D-glutamate ligase